ncbi:4'-phosphopantetheinyl transferase [Streptomyces sp. NPDC057433]|uniref:4'-phosphopantetheinyl transferase family protein n=1 Tax=Streptomyces sp. NPDC057433 TaxID=3346132 RepID=UPI00367AACC3
MIAEEGGRTPSSPDGGEPGENRPLLDEEPTPTGGPPMIEMLLPPGVAHAEAWGDLADAWLYPAEESVVDGAGPERRAEFTTARHLARAALSHLGVAPAPLLPGPRRAPDWPTGVVGSITHCAGYRAAVVARRTSFVTLGVDAEPNAPLPANVLRRIATAAELAQVAELLAVRPEVCWDRLVFSVKEAVHKAWWPLTRQWLGFHDTDVVLDADGAAFTTRLRVPGPRTGHRSVRSLHGRWLARHGMLLTAVARPAVPGPG